MDKNKLIQLKDCGYKIQKCCDLCKNSRFELYHAYFGTCNKKQYKHLKHSDKNRQLSINRYGVCKDEFELDERKADWMLSNYLEFMDK